MYLKNDFTDKDDKTIIGKAIKCKKLREILEMLPGNYLLNSNRITGNFNVLDDGRRQIGYIDIAEDELEIF